MQLWLQGSLDAVLKPVVDQLWLQMRRDGPQVVDLSPRAALFVEYEPAYTNHSAYVLIHVAADIAHTKRHAIQAPGVGIPKLTDRKPCAPVFLKNFIQAPSKMNVAD